MRLSIASVLVGVSSGLAVLFSFLLGSTYAIVGAAAFLASAQKMPITALILIFEFTRVNPSFLLPVALCILGASFTSKILAR